jgi:energy-coupling factor transport system substrate-specific component
VRAQVAYLEHAQNADGGLGAAPGQRSDPLFAGWGALGLESAGAEVGALRSGPGRPSLLGYVAATAAGTDVGALERTILVTIGAGADPAHFGGRDLVAELSRHVSARGAINGEVNLTAFGLLALRAAGASPALQARSAGWLVRAAGPGGGDGLLPGGDADADDTGAVLQALGGVAGRAAARGRQQAVAWLRHHQDPDGGFATAGVTGSNAQSTAWAVQGLLAAGVDPASLHRDGHTPVAYLQSLAGADGSVAYARGQRQTPVWVTAEVLMALDGQPLPLAAPAAVAPPVAPPAPAATSTTATTATSSTTAASTTPATTTATTTGAAVPSVTTASTTPAPPRHVHRGVSGAVTRMAARVCALPGLIVAQARIGR